MTNRLFEGKNLVDVFLSKNGNKTVKELLCEIPIDDKEAYEIFKVEIERMIGKEYLRMNPIESFEEFKRRLE